MLCRSAEESSSERSVAYYQTDEGKGKKKVQNNKRKATAESNPQLSSEPESLIPTALFGGGFPVYAYMYTLRQFMRMNEVKREEIERFVEALSGKQLSIRDIEQLAHGYFRGPDSFRQEVQSGNFALPLAQMRQVPKSCEDCSEFERVLLKDLEITQKYMQRVMGKSLDPRLESRAFHAQSHLLTAGITSRARAFFDLIRKLNVRNGQA